MLTVSSDGMLTAFTAGLTLITISELGDKTFFIALCLAMRYPRRWVFIGATLALAAMTVLSVGLGRVVALLPKEFTHYASIVLFILFGLKLLYDAYKMENGSLAMVEGEACESIEKVNFDRLRGAIAMVTNAFMLTFVAEWGDRTQFTTISLAAAQNPFGVIAGGILGHAICAAIAVYAGRAIASHLSEKVITGVGGILFLIFAGVTVAQGVH
jgi:Ca2+/H+ antiporter, TMEM165/GDT1 family